MSLEIFQGMMGAQVDRYRNISGMTGAKLTDIGILQADRHGNISESDWSNVDRYGSISGMTRANLRDMRLFQEMTGAK
jgi:hypothetical protein